MTRLPVLVFAIFMSLACGSTNTSFNQKRDRDATDDSRIDDALALAKEDHCIANSADPETDCAADLTELRFSDGRFDMPQSNGEAVLIMESQFALFLPLTRYRNRVVEMYKIAGGRLERYDPSIKIPRRLRTIMRWFGGPEFTSIVNLSRLEPLAETYNYMQKYNSGHGNTIMGVIFEHNPTTPVVLVESGHLADIYGEEILCKDFYTPQDWQDMERVTWVLADELGDILDRHDVKYLNMSFGHFDQATMEDMDSLCGWDGWPRSEVSRLTELYRPIYGAMRTAEGRLAFQAASVPGKSGPFDCQSEEHLTNTVVVGAINKIGSELDASGVHPTLAQDELESHLNAVGFCADLYVNLGLTRNFTIKPETLLESYAFGFGASPAGGRIPSTSNAAPLGLSYAIYMRSSRFAGQPFDDKLVRDLKKALTLRCDDGRECRCKYQDPTIHQHLEVFRQGYR